MLYSARIFARWSIRVTAQDKYQIESLLPPMPELRTRLPSEETVDAFMKQTFGYDPAVSWKWLDIRPTEAQGI